MGQTRGIWWSMERYLILPVMVLLLLFMIMSTGYIVVARERTRAAGVITAPDGIERLEEVMLGGYPQWISLRGQSRQAPILLFVHGGPGASAMVPLRHYNRELEQHFVVVSWDQRGAGKSYSASHPPDQMEKEQFVQDAVELTRRLRKEFEQDRIYLVGHSWGTIISTLAAARHGEYFHAYVGIGQAVHFVDAEKISYQFTLDTARARGHDRAVEELEAIGPPPYGPDEFREKLAVQRKWLFHFEGEVYGETSNLRWLLGLLHLHLIAPEYSVQEIVQWVQGNTFSGEALWETLLATDLPSQVRALDIPVYLFSGRHDYVTVFEKVQEYYELLEAPHKELVWFEYSAHSPNFEEPDRFVQEMIRVKEETLPRP